MRSIIFEGDTWAEYEKLWRKDKATHKNLCRILQEMQRNDPALGMGKPEALKYELSGLRSRRISHRDRLIYTFDDQSISIFAIGGHYELLYCIDHTRLPQKNNVPEHLAAARALRAKTVATPLTDDALNAAKNEDLP